MSRAKSEIEAYRSGNHVKNRASHQSLFEYLYNTPNSLREMDDFEDFIKANVVGGSVLEVGCGTGRNCRRLIELGAKEVHGVDISPDMLEVARRQERNPNIHFYEHDIHVPFKASFDLIVGRAVLHHVDYQSALRSLYDSLNPGGVMTFAEPLGSNLIMRVYWRHGSQFHTPDERPFYTHDLAWIKQNFKEFHYDSYNYITLPIAIILHFFYHDPDNFVTRLCDSLDQCLLRSITMLKPRGRSAIFYFTKPSA